MTLRLVRQADHPPVRPVRWRRRPQINLVTMGAIMGSNVRTGLEDNTYLAKGVLAQTNADLVAKVVRILTELSLEVATPDEARSLLGLKGFENVGF